jgi:hypothetical protein
LGTTVYFTYVAIQNDHFIGITPGGSGVGNCVFQFRGPNSAGAVDACQPAGTGTYTFTDQQTFNSGQLIVTP